MTPTPAAPFDPLEPPDGRWHAAGRPGRGAPADRAVRLYRAGWEAGRTAADRRALAARHPALAAAHAIYRSGDAPARAALEARVLAGEPAADIAAVLGYGPGVVEAYEAVFFDVRRALDAPDYIITRVIGPRAPGRGPGALWRLLGYLGGPYVLDLVMGGTSTRPPPGSVAEADPFLAAEAAAAARRRLALAAWGDGDPAAVARLLDVVGGSTEPRTAIEQHVSAMLNEIPWLTGADAERAITGPLAGFDAGAGELRDHELLEVARGHIPESAGELAGLVLPPRPKASVLMGIGELNKQPPPTPAKQPSRPATPAKPQTPTSKGT